MKPLRAFGRWGDPRVIVTKERTYRMRIDVHTHVQPPEFLEALVASGRYECHQDDAGHIVVREKGARFLTTTPQMRDPAQRVEEMDASGIDVQIISVTTP